MNDIVDKLFYVKLSMYADDCVLYLSGNIWDSIRSKMQEVKCKKIVLSIGGNLITCI